MVALNEELSGIAGEPQARSGCGAAEGAMTFPPKNQSNPRSVPYCSDSYLLDSDSSRHYARSRNYSPSIGRFTSQDPLQFINGANTYQFVMSNPVGNVDPSGLDVIGFVYELTPIDGPSYVGSAVRLGGRLVPGHPYFPTMTEPTTQITIFPVDAGSMPETRAELNRALRAMEQEVMDRTGNFGRPDLCNLRRAATPENKDRWTLDYDLKLGDPEDIADTDPALLVNLDSMLGTDGISIDGGDQLVPLLTDGSIDITALPGEAAVGDGASEILPFLILGE